MYAPSRLSAIELKVSGFCFAWASMSAPTVRFKLGVWQAFVWGRDLPSTFLSGPVTDLICGLPELRITSDKVLDAAINFGADFIASIE